MQLNNLTELGWQAFFQQQLTLDEWESASPARIIEYHRSEILVVSESAELRLPILTSMPDMVVGDWLLLDNQMRFLRLLDRLTCFSRKAAGSQIKTQLISANVDTAFIVSSMNDDFNLNRLERFLSVVYESGAEPVVLLSKSDLVDSVGSYVAQVQKSNPALMVEALNCLSPASTNQLTPWLVPGRTLAVLGSSGVGKSTLVNTLLGEDKQSTSGIREDDSKGRHTTTQRSLIPLPSGALILDTPGMREIQLADAKDGIASAYSDIEALAEECRFADCSHMSEPGCAVVDAVNNGELDPRRLDNYLKLLREEAHNSATLSERRAKERALGKFYKNTQGDVAKFKGRS